MLGHGAVRRSRRAAAARRRAAARRSTSWTTTRTAAARRHAAARRPAAVVIRQEPMTLTSRAKAGIVARVSFVSAFACGARRRIRPQPESAQPAFSRSVVKSIEDVGLEEPHEDVFEVGAERRPVEEREYDVRGELHVTAVDDPHLAAVVSEPLEVHTVLGLQVTIVQEHCLDASRVDIP